MRCSFSSAERFAVCGLFAHCCSINCRQPTRWPNTPTTATVNTLIMMMGRINPGFAAISSKVAFGLNRTPVSLPKALSRAGCGVVLSIELGGVVIVMLLLEGDEFRAAV